MVKKWMQGALKLAKEVEVALDILSKKEQLDLVEQNNSVYTSQIHKYPNPKDKLKKLQILIVVHIEELVEQYPYTLLVYKAVDDLMNMNASENLVQSWLNSINDFIEILDTKSSI